MIKELAKKFKDGPYRRPLIEDIEEKETTTKMKILRAFLHPDKDRCLHIRRTLDQYYYSTLTDADERTNDQVVYRFAMKQHKRILEEEMEAKNREKERERDRRENMKYDGYDQSESSRHSSWVHVEEDDTDDSGIPGDQAEEKEPSWNPPKVMMVNQLWMWIIDGGKFKSQV